jgi:hypothetical protein
MRKTTSIDLYVDAVRGLAALRRAVTDDGDPRKDAIKDARILVSERIRPLNGGDLAAANRILAGFTAPRALEEAQDGGMGGEA